MLARRACAPACKASNSSAQIWTMRGLPGASERAGPAGDMQCASPLPLLPMSSHWVPLQPLFPSCLQTSEVQFMPGWHLAKHGSDAVIGLQEAGVGVGAGAGPIGDIQCASAPPRLPMSSHWVPLQPILPNCWQTSAVQFMLGWHFAKQGSDAVIGLQEAGGGAGAGPIGDMQCASAPPLLPMSSHWVPLQPILPNCWQTSAVQFMLGWHFAKQGSDAVIGLQEAGAGVGAGVGLGPGSEPHP